MLVILLNLNKNNLNEYKEMYNTYSRDDFRFITCSLGFDHIKGDSRIKKYFDVLDKYVPYANVVFCVSKYTKIEPSLLNHENIKINIERFGNQTKKDILHKYQYSRFFFNGIRYGFYIQYLKKHPEIKYVAISDDDMLFFRDPFPLIAKDPTVVHFMEDFFPLSNTKSFNYIWINAWNYLNKTKKKKCKFKKWNKTFSFDKFKNLIPLNCGLMIGKSKNIIKIAELIYNRFICPGMFNKNAEQGLLNYLDISGELKDLGIPIKRHNIYNDSFISCPNLLPIENYIKQITSSHFIAIHHYQHLNYKYIKRSPKEFQLYLKKNFTV